MGLVGLRREYAERQAGDDVVGEAIACVSTYPDVALADATTNAALERLLEVGREQGRLRPDATAEDLRLIFAATRAAVQLEPGAWRRMLSSASTRDPNRPPRSTRTGLIRLDLRWASTSVDQTP